MTGKEIRLNRLFKHSEKLLIVPMDHGVTVGPIDGLQDMSHTVKQITSGQADAVVVHKGLVKEISKHIKPDGCELIVHLSASTALNPESNSKELVSSVDHAIRLGATAVSVHVNLGNPYEPQMLKDLGRVAEDCDLWGIPLLAMMYVRDGSENSEYDVKRVKHAARVAQELGADLVKVNYTGSPDTFAEVTRSVKIPVLIAGGPKLESSYDVLVMVTDAIEAGAKGISIGRNIFQNPNPEQLVRVIRKILDKEVRCPRTNGRGESV